MKHARKLFLALPCAVLCLVSSFAQAQSASNGAQQARPATKNLLVGVVDLRSVLQNHPVIAEEIPALGMELQKAQVELANAKEVADKKVAQLQQEFNLVVGTPEFEDKIGDVRKEFSDEEFKAREVQQKLVAKRTQLLFKAYQDLQTAITAVAKQNGIIIVHSKIKIAVPENAAVSREALALEEADQNTIVWNRPECDITELVKAQLAAMTGSVAQNATNADNPLGNLGSQAMNARSKNGGFTGATTSASSAPKRTASAPTAQQRR